LFLAFLSLTEVPLRKFISPGKHDARKANHTHFDHLPSRSSIWFFRGGVIYLARWSPFLRALLRSPFFIRLSFPPYLPSFLFFPDF
jgi:hypothetical protein